MKKNKIQQSKELKSEIYKELSQTSRFCNIYQKVADMIKRGQEPVVIESWNAFIKKTQIEDVIWEHILTPEERQSIKCDDTIETRASLNAELPQPFREAKIKISVTLQHSQIIKKTVIADEWLMQQLVYFDHRDQMYFKLFFTELGYSVKIGNIGNKYGLLISLGEH